jgi:hypothetical protein
VIPYTITFSAQPGILDSTILTDSLPAGLSFADALTATYGSAWYSLTLNTIYWTNQSVTGTQAFQNLSVTQAGVSFGLADSPHADSSAPALPTGLSLSLVSPDGSEGGKRRPRHAPRRVSSPSNVLWDQPLSITNTTAYANQDFEATMDAFDMYIADDFTNTVGWDIDTIFVPGNLWSGGTSLTHALTLNWQIYADDDGVPDGVPTGEGMSPSWHLSLPPTHTLVTLGAGLGGYTSNVTLTLPTPINLPPGAWWLVFYPRMDSAVGGQYGRHVSETANGHDALVINPGGAFGFPTHWTSVQDPSAWGMAQQDFAFRLEGQPAPSVVTVTFNVTVTAGPGESVVNTADLNYRDFILSADTALDVPLPEYVWNKDVTVNGAPYTAPQMVEAGDQVQIVDSVWITSPVSASFAITETWSESLELTEHISSTGSAMTDTRTLVWHAAGIPEAWHTLTKTFVVREGTWRTDTVTETLNVEWLVPEERVISFQFAAPDIDVAPTALAASLNPDVTLTRSLAIENVGDADLTWGIAEAPDVTWLSETPAGGTLAPADQTSVDVVFDTSGLSDGIYTTTLQVTSDDPDEPQIDVSVTLTVTSGCISVSGADFIFAPAAPEVGEMVTFTGSVAAGTPPITYTWDFGDGDAANGQVVAHTYSLGATYPVVMSATNACPSQDTASHDVAVTSDPDITVDPLMLSAELNPDDTTTRILTVDNVGTADLTWSLAEAPDVTWLSETPASGTLAPAGQASVDVVFDATGLGDGIYTTTLQVTSDDPDEPQIDVGVMLTVTSACISISGADFTFEPAAPGVGETVTFTGSVAAGTPPITYTWDFGDGDAASGQMINHTYPLNATYTVVMTATNTCPSQMVVSKDVVVSPRRIYLPLVMRY